MVKYWTAHILAGRHGGLAICLLSALLITAQGSCQQSANAQPTGSDEASRPVAPGEPASATASQPATATTSRDSGGMKGFASRFEPAKDMKQTKSGDISNLAWQTIGYTVLILLLGGAVIILSRRLLPKLGLAPASSRDLKLMETLCINSRQRVHLLKVGGRRILVGSSRDAISMLADVTEPQPQRDHAESENTQDRPAGKDTDQ